MRFFNLILILLIGQNVLAQYPGCVGSANTSAMHTDSSSFVAWAKSCSITRGLQDISNSVLGYASVGDSTFALSKADGAVVSLGDNGIAVVSFSAPITNGPGFDFAVFENSFNDSFLELAFVEVSSDGINYFRFHAVSNLPVSPQYDNSAIMDASKINNLAGKYRALYGTPFDLNELTGIPQLDVTNITHVKIIDVVGSINHAYARYDSQNQIINDPWPTPFNSSGFDLDAVGVINQKAVGMNEINSQNYFKLYPNPANDILFIQTNEIHEKTEISLSDLTGNTLIKEYTQQTTLTIDISAIQSGVYLLTISNTKNKQRTKIIKQ